MSSDLITNPVLKTAIKLVDHMQPLKTKKDPVTSAVFGFFAGGLGLGIWFRSWIDFFVPIMLWIGVAILAVPTAEIGLIAAPFFCALYGWSRATSSNQKLDGTFPGTQPHTAAGTHRYPIAPPPLQPRPGASHQPPLIDVSGAGTSPTIPLPRSPAPASSRLQQLETLRQQGLVSQGEYESKRQKILEEI